MAGVSEKVTEVAVDAAKMTEEHAHEVAEAIPELVQGMARIKLSFAALGVAIGAAAGAFTAYKVTEKRLREKYAALAEEEIDGMREHFRARMVVKEEKPDLTDLSKRTEGLGYSGTRPVPEGGPGAPVTVPENPELRNVFEQQPPIPGAVTWDYELEVAHRATLAPGVPYIIHEDERHEAVDYAETTLTWYTGDDVLCDDDDRALPNVDELIGLDNLNRFGDGTDDDNVMFIRNDRLEVIMEVNRSPNSYTEEVHGLSHSEPEARRRPRHPKWDD